MKHYTEQIKSLNNPTFQQIRSIAKNSLSHLSNNEIEKIREKLNRGKKVIETQDELSQYLFSYGNMHEEKIHRAVEKIDSEILNGDFEIIDWGCGQGLATITFFDFLNKNNYLGRANKVTLIEPSKIALNRASIHVKSYAKRAGIVIEINKFLDEIKEVEIKSTGEVPIIHFFSNILDISNIDLLVLSNKIKNTIFNDNIIVSVGPVYANNERLDHFYREYFNSPKPLIFEIDKSEYEYGNSQKCSFKAKVFKLETNIVGNLIPVEFYPSVQFHAAYKLDCITGKSVPKNLSVSATSTPFDIGASVYDDIHPILAVLNNIITRGLPTKASPFMEEVFQKTFKYSQRIEKYGTFSYPSSKKMDIEKVLTWFQSVITKHKPINYSEIDTELLQLVFSPIAIARLQKTILEALMTDKLDIKSKEWKILVEEKDVPCSALAFADLSEMFNNLTKLSEDYQDLVFPEIKLDIISNEVFVNSGLHLNNKNTFSEAKPKHSNIEYDLVIDISVFETKNIEKESFSKFRSKNNCYFNSRSVIQVNGERSIYTTDRIVYRELVIESPRGKYTDIKDTKDLLKYFLQLIFRKKKFRAGQLPILNRAIQNKSVIGLLPTGGGKSLTYQLAAMLQPGVTLIVDPLRSLMKDQYDGLITAGIDTCAFINSSLTDIEKKEAERKMEQSKLLFVFLSPERLAIYKFREKLKNMHELNVYFSYGVIDEVHCVSEWGHDFRFSYLHLGRNLYNYVRAKEGKVSLFGLTATASFDVLADVERELSGNGAFPLDAETIVRYENSNRLELQYKIEKVNVEFQDEISYIKEAIKNKKKWATIDKLNEAIVQNKIFLENNLPLPVRVADKWGFYNAKSEFLKNYIKDIPIYSNEIQSEKSISNIKNAFVERQGNSEGVDNELNTNIPNEYYSKQLEYEQAGIIFCPHKSNTPIAVKENKDSLKSLVPDVGTFSGGDDDDDNSMGNLELFRTNKQPLMIATKAFGMGIDKPNVRFTINLNYSSSLESFVQEAGRGGRDRKIALSIIFISNYRLARISSKFKDPFPLQLKNKWFKLEDLKKIINHYKLDIDKKYIDYLTPENDLVRLFCNEGPHLKYFDKETGKEKIKNKYFGFKNCNDEACQFFKKCQLRYVPNEVENWIYKDDLYEILSNKNIIIDKKHIEYQNADYETVMYFYNNSFKGEFIEKQSMHNILCIEKTDVFYGDDAEIKTKEIITVDGFLTTLIKSNLGDEIVSFVKYIKPDLKKEIEGTDVDLAKAIYRMTCIELIEDFTQDYANNRYRIVCKRKKEGEYYKGLERFLLRYYSADRAKEEIKNVYDIDVKSDSELEKEIFQCLNYLTTFVYEKISVKRKRAIDDMRTFCITGANESKDWKETNEELKDFIYYYFNSKYAKSDYIAGNGENYSLTIDTAEDGKLENAGKISADWILFKYLKIIDEGVEQGVPIDNVKHLQGAVRLLRRSLTDSNPTLSLLNSFCILFLGTNNNENLEKEVIENYKEGMFGFAEREKDFARFLKMFNNYNLVLKPFSNGKLEKLNNEIIIKIHHDKFKKITSKYLE